MKEPVWNSATELWSEGEEDLIRIDPGAFWSEHSERSFLNTFAAGLGHPKDDRDRLGWKTEGSEEYVRASRVIVENMQSNVARVTRRNKTSPVHDFSDEDTVICDLREYWVGRGIPGALVERQLDMLKFFDPQIEARDDFGITHVSTSAVPKKKSIFQQDIVTSETTKDLSEEEEEEPGKHKPPPPGFVISISKKRFRRLHRYQIIGACHLRPGIDYALFESVPKSTSLDDVKFDDYCRNCWPGGKQPEDHDTRHRGIDGSVEDLESTSSSASVSSTEDEKSKTDGAQAELEADESDA
jgi:hypothetical protein